MKWWDKGQIYAERGKRGALTLYWKIIGRPGETRRPMRMLFTHQIIADTELHPPVNGPSLLGIIGGQGD